MIFVPVVYRMLRPAAPSVAILAAPAVSPS
jgi:hypothetical protein